MITVLLNPIGVPATRGTIHMLRNNPDDAPVRIIGVDSNPNVAQRHLVDAFHTLPPDSPQVLKEICAKRNINVLE